MKIQRKFIALAVAASASLFACSTTPAAPDDDVVAAEPAEPAQTVPELREFSFIDGEPQVVELAQTDDVSSFRVGQIEVIHMPTPANEVVTARLYLRGGSANMGESIAGIDRLALAVAVNGGTESTPKDEFTARLDAVGSSVSFVADRDFSAYAMNTVYAHFDETWDLFEEAIFEPAFPDDEVELRRNRQLAEIDSLRDDPDRLVTEVARDLAFADHPYFVRQLGTRENVSQFTTDQLRAWQRHLLTPERMVLIVVGNIDRDHLIEKVERRLGRLALSGVAVPELPGISHDAPALRVEQMRLPTNYIVGYFAAPTVGHPDYAAMMLATRHLRGRLFEEVRTVRNLTYAVSSGLGSRGDNVGFLYVTAVDPAATMPVIFDEVARLQNEPLTEQQLEEVRNVYLTSHYMALETNAGVAGQLALARLFAGDWTLTQRFLDDVMNVTAEDIQRVAQTYIQNIQFGVVGNPDLVPPSLFGVDSDEAETVDEVDEADEVSQLQ